MFKELTIDDMLTYNYIKQNETTFKTQRDFNSNVSSFKCLPEAAFVLCRLAWSLLDQSVENVLELCYWLCIQTPT